MSHHPITTPASPSLASSHFDASFDSNESLTTTFRSPVLPTLETTTVTEVALGYHRNGQYSITAMTTSTGAVAERYAYTAYGQPTILNASGTLLTSSAVGNRYTYTGREWDETLGLHHFRARWMSPLAGRFLGRDPIGYSRKNKSLFQFVRSSPLIFLDPSGLIDVDPDTCLRRCYADPYSVQSCVDKCWDCAKSFEIWMNNNQTDPAWARKLTPCPCELGKQKVYCYSGMYPVYEVGEVDTLPLGDWEWDKGTWSFVAWLLNVTPTTHPGATNCIRSKSANTPGIPSQQCCYKNGFLITNGVGAGSADSNTPAHGSSDVDPWTCAARLDENFSSRTGEVLIQSGAYMDEYQKRRPANNAKNYPSLTAP